MREFKTKTNSIEEEFFNYVISEEQKRSDIINMIHEDSISRRNMITIPTLSIIYDQIWNLTHGERLNEGIL